MRSIFLAGHDINYSHSILVDFTVSADMQLLEVNEVMTIISDLARSSDNISLSVEFDEKARDDSIEVKIYLFKRRSFCQRVVQTT